jgi:erythronate-4-phosphate dehydrogenase
MKLLVELAIPGIELFTPFFDCVQLPAPQISAARLQDVDILLVRSVTPVNAALLDASPVRFVGSCTIGVDHIDQCYLQNKGITFAHAPGCNAIAVSEYVLQTLLRYAGQVLLPLPDITVGVIGWGNVGKAVTRLLDALQIAYRVYDPLLQVQVASDVPSSGWASLQEVLAANVITLHVPLTDDTRRMLSVQQFAQILPKTLLINTSRGEVLDELALFANYSPEHFFLAVDVFAHEPAIDPRWLCYAWQMTPHIAGHSERGKWRGTEMIYDALAHFLVVQQSQLQLPPRGADHAPALWMLNNPQDTLTSVDLHEWLYQVFDLRTTDQVFRQALAKPQSIAQVFRQVRADYVPRREFQDVMILDNQRLSAQLMAIGFKV